MKNLFKRKHSREEEKTEEKKGIFKGRKENPESDHVIESKPKGEFLETDEDLGYC
jgi:hypothetical protein